MDKSDKTSKISKAESEELKNLDNELKDLIKKNESLKIGMEKIFNEIEKKNNNISSKILSKLTSNPSKFIVSMLIGTNLALVVYGLYMGDILVTYFSETNRNNRFCSMVILAESSA